MYDYESYYAEDLNSSSYIETIYKFMMMYSVILMVVGIVVLVAMYKLFKKCGKPGWAAIIPIYNMWVLLQIGDLPGWLSLIPGVNVICVLIAYANIGKKFNKSTAFILGLIFLTPIFLCILAFEKDKVNEVSNETNSQTQNLNSENLNLINGSIPLSELNKPLPNSEINAGVDIIPPNTPIQIMPNIPVQPNPEEDKTIPKPSEEFNSILPPKPAETSSTSQFINMSEEEPVPEISNIPVQPTVSPEPAPVIDIFSNSSSSSIVLGNTQSTNSSNLVNPVTPETTNVSSATSTSMDLGSTQPTNSSNLVTPVTPETTNVSSATSTSISTQPTNSSNSVNPVTPETTNVSSATSTPLEINPAVGQSEPSNATICPNCGASLAANAELCFICGQSLKK